MTDSTTLQAPEAVTRERELERAGIQAVIAAAAAVHGIEVDLVLSRLRAYPVAAARRTAAHVLRLELGMSLEAIGRALGRDHSTVHNLLRRGAEDERTQAARARARALLGRPPAPQGAPAGARAAE